MKIRYIGYTLNLLKNIAVASPTRAVTANLSRVQQILKLRSSIFSKLTM